MGPKPQVQLPQSVVYEKDPKVLQSILLRQLQQLDLLEQEINSEQDILMRQYMDIKKRNSSSALTADKGVSSLKEKLLLLKKQERSLLDQQRSARNAVPLDLDYQIQKARDLATDIILKSGLKRYNVELMYKQFGQSDEKEHSTLMQVAEFEKLQLDEKIAELSSLCEKQVLTQVNELRKAQDQLQRAFADIDKIQLDVRKQETWISTLQHQIRIFERK